MDITIEVEDYRLNVRAAGIMIHNGKILLHRNINSDHYALIGGRIAIGENSVDTIQREMEEEVGKKVEVKSFAGAIENFFEMKGSKYHEIMFIHFIEFIDEKDKKIEYTLKNLEGKEHLQYEWIELNELDKYRLLPENLKYLIDDGKYPFHIVNDELK